MPFVTRVLRNASVSTLKTYFNHHGIDLGEPMNWQSRSNTILAKRVLHSLESLGADAYSDISNDFERIDAMTDEIGRTAIEASLAGKQALEVLDNAYDRALWLLLNDSASFRRAEETRYADHYRQGRMWAGYVGTKGLPVSKNPKHHEEFISWIKSRFKCTDVHMDVFERTRPCINENLSHLVQVVIYRNGMPDNILDFENGALIRKKYRPVLEFVITYESRTGVIEVLAKEKESRARLARMFAELLLQKPILGVLLPLRQYDLSALLKRTDFPTDPQDGIAVTMVESLGLKHVEDKKGGVKINSPRDDEQLDIYQRAKKWFPGCDPLQNGFYVQQAKISVLFRPDKNSSRGKVVPIELTLPNGCTLKGKTEQERLICEKYLPRWGLVKEV